MDKVLSDFQAARKRFEIFERFYRSLSKNAKTQLRRRSSEYKRYLKEIRGLIRPGVEKTCSTCASHCCRLYSPELSINMAGTVGGFELKDYLLARCDRPLPEPRFENAAKNLCAFWSDGCVLPVDCRSLLCTGFFCNRLSKELEMESVWKVLENIRGVVDRFSIAVCMT
ncbi:MAG: hypothetical protein AB1512_07700 [Thermodesulfobacteriota bacterium]